MMRRIKYVKNNCVYMSVDSSLYDKIEEVRKQVSKEYDMKIGLAQASKLLANKIKNIKLRKLK